MYNVHDEEEIVEKIELHKNDIIKITSVTGHVLTYDYLHPFDKKTDWSESNPFDIIDLDPVELPIRQNLFDQLFEFGSTITHLIIATDWDPQGESIGAQIKRIIQQGNVNNNKIICSRMRFTATNVPSLMRSFENQYMLDIPLVESVDSLRRQDLRMGASLTRFLTVGVQEKGSSRLISYGPCQSSVLWVIANRYNEKKKFEPTPYWELFAIYNQPNQIEPEEKGKKKKSKKKAKKTIKKAKKVTKKLSDPNQFIFTWDNNPITSEKDLKTSRAIFTNQNTALLSKQEKSIQIINRPKPLDTDTLESDCAKYFRVSPKLIADIAEKLYNNGFITYPRTESSFYLQKDFTGVCEKFIEKKVFLEEAEACLHSGNITNPSKGKYSKDHEPIIPVKAGSSNDISSAIKGNDFENSLAWRIYEYVVKRFFATIHLDVETEVTHTSISIVGENFSHISNIIVNRGFLDVYPYRVINENPFPNLKEKTAFEITIKEEKKFTLPPELWTESQLIREMARLNIGTDATRSQHIATVIERGYANVQSGSRSLFPTEIGLAFFNIFSSYSEKLILPEIRGTVEQWTIGIRSGEFSSIQVDENVKNLTKEAMLNLENKKEEIFTVFVEKIKETTREGENFGICLNCESELLLKSSTKGKRYLQCANKDCSSTFLLPKKGTLTLLQEKCHACPMYPIQVGSGTKSWIFCPNCWNTRQDAEGLLFCSRCEYETCPFSQISKDFSVKHDKGNLGTCPKCLNGEIILFFDEWRTKLECNNCNAEYKAPNIRAGTSIQVDGPCKLCNLSTLLIRRKGKATYNMCPVCSLLCFQCLHKCY